MSRAAGRGQWGIALLATGLVVSVLSASGDALPHSVGRVALWLVEPLVACVVLAFPSGRLHGRLDRGLAFGAVALVGLLYLPTMLLTVRFPEPVPYGDCGGRCPDNAFAVVDHEPAVIGDVVGPLRNVLAVVLLAAVGLRLAQRARRAPAPWRATFVPVLVVAAWHTSALAAYLAIRGPSPTSWVLDPIGWLYLLSLPALVLTFGVAHVARLAHASHALEQLAHQLRTGTPVTDVEAAVAAALDDPSLRLVRRAPGQWSIDHDPVLGEAPELVRAAAEMAELRTEHDLLVRRLVDAGDRERRRIERALHDGAQQGLVALRIRLSLLQERLERTAPDEVPAVEQLGQDVEAAIDQVRTLAKGIYPSLLAQHGVGPALRAAVRNAPLPVTVDAEPGERWPEEVEAAVYFTCMEALQNAFKHARASVVHVRLTERAGDLCFRVDDDGRGFDAGAAGSGVAGMRDRMSAVGGRLEIDSRPGAGTSVCGCVPYAELSGPLRAGGLPDPRPRGTSRPPSRAG